MRKRKTIKIDDREYVIRELTVKEIINMFTEASQKAEESDANVSGVEFWQAEMDKFLKLAMENSVTKEEFLSMAPSEIKELYDGFKEVNEVFFDIARQVGIAGVLGELTQAVRNDFSKVFVGSLKRVTEKSLITDTPSTLQH